MKIKFKIIPRSNLFILLSRGRRVMSGKMYENIVCLPRIVYTLSQQKLFYDSYHKTIK